MIREIGLEKVVLVGQSHGGFLAQVIAQRHPDMVDGLVISNSGCIYEGLDDERIYMTEFFRYMFSKLTNKGERHMCNLMIDLLAIPRMSKRDFAYFDGKVLHLLSKDDNTFSEGIKAGLTEMMTNPEVSTEPDGGHLALILKIDDFITQVSRFIDEKL